MPILQYATIYFFECLLFQFLSDGTENDSNNVLEILRSGMFLGAATE